MAACNAPFRLHSLLAGVLAGVFIGFGAVAGWADDRHRSDSDARYLHYIPLYDVDNRRITAESTRPYSPRNTCGRCHDYETIRHGWHFNAFEPDSEDGRPGEPWIWTDAVTGTQLPLSYRQWDGLYSPSEAGLTPFEMTSHFGARLPGGNMGEAGEAKDDQNDSGEAESSEVSPRWKFSGSLEIDCMVCHAVSGAYDFERRRSQIAEQNFAWAPTAALRLAEIEGRVSSIDDDADLDEESTQERLPTAQYNPARFESDGTVFMDLVRRPSSNACYQCHSVRQADEQGVLQRWVHDQDVHLRAGMECVDCHRNGIDHEIVRGFEGQSHPEAAAIQTLSCRGCHLGVESPSGLDGDDELLASAPTLAGRLGSPKPMHEGLPPLHFEKMACTACHSGPMPRQEALRTMTSLAHGLGESTNRTGEELPAIVGPVYAPATDGRIHPHRATWPAFWGELVDGKIRPLNPNEVFAETRRSLRVRKDFVEEVLEPRVSSSDLKELLGEDRAREEDQWSKEEQARVEEFQRAAGREAFDEKVAAALQSLEEERGIEQAVYVSAGTVYARGEQENTLETLNLEADGATSMVRWPLAHNVRPAGWSLGARGCTECHSEEGLLFASTVTASGPGPETPTPLTMASLQGVDSDQRLQWNELFRGRASFKYVIAASIVLLLMILCIGIGAAAVRLTTPRSES